jgi:hypothetical protein
LKTNKAPKVEFVTKEIETCGGYSTEIVRCLVDGKPAKRINSNIDSSRSVFLTEGLVVKAEIYMSPHYLDQCRTEHVVYKKIKPHHKKFFAKTISYGKRGKIRYNVQKRHRLHHNISFENVDFIMQIADKYNIGDLEPGHNIAMDRDTKRPIIYDYGY